MKQGGVFMKEEIEKILDLLEEGKITKEEATELIKAVKSGEKFESKETKGNESAEKRMLRVSITRNDGKKEVAVNIPFGVVKFGLAIARKMGKNSINVNGSEIPIDLDKLSEALSNPDFKGKIVDINDEEDGKHIDVEIV